MSRLIDEMGNIYGRLTVIGRAENNRQGKAMWICACQCGEQAIIYGSSLRSGATHSCGCLNAEISRVVNTRHGLAGTPEYTTWKSMKGRCLNPRDHSFSNYGGRGIMICERWLSDFKNFIFDMGPRPSPKHSLDRIDNNGDYEPTNCRWATAKEQSGNMRKSVLVTYEGRTQCVAAWANEFDMKRSTLRGRVLRGWPIEKAFSQAVRPRICG